MPSSTKPERLPGDGVAAHLVGTVGKKQRALAGVHRGKREVLRRATAAMQLPYQTSFDAVILDVNLTERSGLDLLK